MVLGFWFFWFVVTVFFVVFFFGSVFLFVFALLSWLGRQVFCAVLKEGVDS